MGYWRGVISSVQSVTAVSKGKEVPFIDQVLAVFDPLRVIYNRKYKYGFNYMMIIYTLVVDIPAAVFSFVYICIAH